MAAANMKAVKNRIRSVQNTMQITRAMQLVAASKLRRAKDRADASKPYLQALRGTLRKIALNNMDFTSPYVRDVENDKWLYIVIAGDRGLAGGYNANLFKFVEAETQGRDIEVLPVGKKAVEYFKHRNVPIFTEEFAEAAKVKVSDCFEMARQICEAYSSGRYGHVFMCYTDFISMLNQKPTATNMLPLSDFGSAEAAAEDVQTEAGEDAAASDQSGAKEFILYEPDSETVFNHIVPEYLAGLMSTAINISVASELAARRTAMEAATDNAGEMIEKLNLYYNRARQASITQELTEIVAGSGTTG